MHAADDDDDDDAQLLLNTVNRDLDSDTAREAYIIIARHAQQAHISTHKRKRGYVSVCVCVCVCVCVSVCVCCFCCCWWGACVYFVHPVLVTYVLRCQHCGVAAVAGVACLVLSFVCDALHGCFIECRHRRCVERHFRFGPPLVPGLDDRAPLVLNNTRT